MANNWSSNTPTSTSLVFNEISVSHTNGVITSKYGYDDSNLANQCYITLDSTPQHNIVIPFNNLMTLPNAATLTGCTINTNIVDADLVYTGITNNDLIRVSFQHFYKNGINGSVNDSYDLTYLGLFADSDPYGGFQNGVSTLSSPPNVGDTATYYNTGVTGNTTPNILIWGYPIGQNATAFSAGYFAFQFYIPASAATKTYKFQVTLEYV